MTVFTREVASPEEARTLLDSLQKGEQPAITTTKVSEYVVSNRSQDDKIKEMMEVFLNDLHRLDKEGFLAQTYPFKLIATVLDF